MNDQNYHFRYKDFTNHPDYKKWMSDDHDYKKSVKKTEQNKKNKLIYKYLTLVASLRSINFSFLGRKNGDSK